MSLDDDLLEQADVLARYDDRRPRQANLRRAVSSAYYAVFHLLVREASRALSGDPPVQRLVARTFGHGEMKKACQAFLNPGGLPEPLRTITGMTSPSADLRAVAQAFVDLQEARHEADYSLSRTFRRADVLTLVARTRAAFDAWSRVRSQRVAAIFLLALSFGDRWKR